MHDSAGGERLAGWYHVGFTVLYVIAAWWHMKATREHWNR